MKKILITSVILCFFGLTHSVDALFIPPTSSACGQYKEAVDITYSILVLLIILVLNLAILSFYQRVKFVKRLFVSVLLIVPVYLLAIIFSSVKLFFLPTTDFFVNIYSFLFVLLISLPILYTASMVNSLFLRDKKNILQVALYLLLVSLLFGIIVNDLLYFSIHKMFPYDGLDSCYNFN